MSSLLEKGKFEQINESFLSETIDQLEGLANIQKKYNKGDMDTVLNELHDSLVGRYLGFELVNTDKHGFDCKLSETQDIFLESKVASLSSKSWSATFNDTTDEKAKLFKDKRIWLALSVWSNVTTPICICFGQHTSIGDILHDGVQRHKDGKTVRSTQTIGMHKLIFEFGFKILSPTLSTNELIQKLNFKRDFKQLSKEHIIEYKNFNSILDYSNIL